MAEDNAQVDIARLVAENYQAVAPTVINQRVLPGDVIAHGSIRPIIDVSEGRRAGRTDLEIPLNDVAGSVGPVSPVNDHVTTAGIKRHGVPGDPLPQSCPATPSHRGGRK